MEGGSAPNKRKHEDTVEDCHTLDSITEENLQQKHIKQEIFEQQYASGTVSKLLEVENAPCDLNLADGIVMCGQCKIQRASIVCMDQACVSYAYRTWQMTSLFICDGCDVVLHNNNPIMAEHIRTRLAFRNTNVVVRRFENRSMAVQDNASTVSFALQDVAEKRADDSPSVSRMDVQSREVTLKQATLHSKLCSHKPRLMLEKIHTRYRTVLEHNLSRQCLLSDSFRETGVARQTLVDALAIAELKIVDPTRFDDLMATHGNTKPAPRIFELESECRLVMRDYMDIVYCLRGKSLIPFKCNVYSAKK